MIYLLAFNISICEILFSHHLFRGFKLAYVVKPVDASQGDFQSNDDGICGRSTYVAPIPTTPSTVEENTTTTASVENNITRIIGNHSADPHSFPWMVAMLIDNKSFCGASIIDETHILTAGK